MRKLSVGVDGKRSALAGRHLRFALHTPQDCIHHACGMCGTIRPRKLHTVIQGGVGGNTIHMPQLKQAHAQRQHRCRVQLRIGPLQQWPQRHIQHQLPSQDSQHKSGRQVTVLRRKRVDHNRM